MASSFGGKCSIQLSYSARAGCSTVELRSLEMGAAGIEPATFRLGTALKRGRHSRLGRSRTCQRPTLNVDGTNPDYETKAGCSAY